MKRTLAIMVGIGVLIVLVAVVSVVWALYTLAAGLSRSGVNWWAVVSTCLLIPAAMAGHWTGRTEARGYSHGADKVIDKLTGLVQSVVTTRDQSRITIHQATHPAQPQPPVWGISQQPMPQLTYRTAGRDEVDDL